MRFGTCSAHLHRFGCECRLVFPSFTFIPHFPTSARPVDIKTLREHAHLGYCNNALRKQVAMCLSNMFLSLDSLPTTKTIFA